MFWGINGIFIGPIFAFFWVTLKKLQFYLINHVLSSYTKLHTCKQVENGKSKKNRDLQILVFSQ